MTRRVSSSNAAILVPCSAGCHGDNTAVALEKSLIVPQTKSTIDALRKFRASNCCNLSGGVVPAAALAKADAEGGRITDWDCLG